TTDGEPAGKAGTPGTDGGGDGEDGGQELEDPEGADSPEAEDKAAGTPAASLNGAAAVDSAGDGDGDGDGLPHDPWAPASAGMPSARPAAAPGRPARGGNVLAVAVDGIDAGLARVGAGLIASFQRAGSSPVAICHALVAGAVTVFVALFTMQTWAAHGRFG